MNVQEASQSHSIAYKRDQDRKIDVQEAPKSHSIAYKWH